jgi:hypothetical protein
MSIPRLLVHVVMLAAVVLGVVAGTRVFAFFGG